jgi:hypothetical protein
MKYPDWISDEERAEWMADRKATADGYRRMRKANPRLARLVFVRIRAAYRIFKAGAERTFYEEAPNQVGGLAQLLRD